VPKELIDRTYLREIFGIAAGEKGEAEAAELADKLERLVFAHDEDIISIDTEADGLYFLESGTALVLNREGEQINMLRPGAYFGEYAVLSGERRLSTVRSLGRTIVYRLSKEEMMEVLRRHPETYGEFMKRVYGQVSGKHRQLLTLSRMQRGVLQHPRNRTPMSPLRMALQYGCLALVFLLSALFIPKDSIAPIFLLPLLLMTVYVLLTRRTVESLLVAGMMAALLVYRSGITGSYTDALIDSMSSPDNAFTVLVMALMGGVVTLIEASGAVTAFRKLADRLIRSRRSARFASLGIMAVTAIDDCLNMLCSATALHTASDEQRIPREESALMLSLLPTTLCSFLPVSLWGIFVIGSISASGVDSAARLFCKAIPFNFFSIITVLAMLLFCLGRFPLTKTLRKARQRVEERGELWPEGSERYLTRDETETWGRIVNLLLPVAVLIISSLLVRSLFSGRLVLDSACGLVATLLFIFFLYCGQGLMSPEEFFEHLITGVQSMALPILLYLMTMCFSSLLEQQNLGLYFDTAVEELGAFAPLMPAVLFLVSTVFTVIIGSSWAMYVIALPVAIHVSGVLGLSLPLCVGAVISAGIAGEKNCGFTSDSLSVGNAIGCNPQAVLKVRLPYSLLFTGVSLLLYLAFGFII